MSKFHFVALDSKSFDKTIASIQKHTDQFKEQVHQAAMSCAWYSWEHGEFEKANRLLASIDGIARERVAAWLVTYGKLSLNRVEGAEGQQAVIQVKLNKKATKPNDLDAFLEDADKPEHRFWKLFKERQAERMLKLDMGDALFKLIKRAAAVKEGGGTIQHPELLDKLNDMLKSVSAELAREKTKAIIDKAAAKSEASIANVIKAAEGHTETKQPSLH